VFWRRGLLWLAFLGPFFFLSYGYANGVAARQGITDAVVFGWERRIPFLPWTIVPYWSIDLIYGLSFLYCRNRGEVDRHGLRLLTVQLLSVACFLLFPLRFSFDRPASDGTFGLLFDLLMGFDQPYNQAPSLHIGLLVVLWQRYAAADVARFPRLSNAWFVLIALSTLTTWQHHFVDLPTGVLVGFLALWLWPDDRRPPLSAWSTSVGPKGRGLALRYLAAAGLLALIAWSVGSWALWLWWVVTALTLVAVCYGAAGAAGFQKQAGNGRLSPAVTALALPYLLGAWSNSRCWTRRHPQADPVADGVWLGRMPTAGDMAAGTYAALVDCTAELPAPQGPWHYCNLPWLDLLEPEPAQLAEAARHIETARRHGSVCVCCALGYSRSAAAVAAWLLHSGRAASVDDALAQVRERRPGTVLSAEHRAALAASLGTSPAGSCRKTGKPTRTALEHLVGASLSGFARLLTGVSALWLGGAPDPRPRVYFANHRSHWDFVLIWAVLPAGLREITKPVAGADYWLHGAVRRYLAQRVFRAVLIERTPRPHQPNPVDCLAEALAAGESLILFPEGTRNLDDGLLPFKSGIFHLAKRQPQAEFVPVWIENLGRVMPKGALLPAPLLCTLSFGPPLRLAPEETKTQFLARANAALLALAPAD